MTQMDYRKKLGLSVNDQVKGARFYAQMHNYFAGASSVEFDSVIECAFCDKIGVQTNEANPILDDLWISPKGLERAWIYIKEYQTNFLELLYCCVTLINVYPRNQRGVKNGLKTVVINALEDCQIAYDLFNDDDGVFIFPKGAKELDDALISQPLEWLADYPKAHKTYCTALKQYSDGKYIRDVADNLRKALEDFLREFLGNEKDLNSNKKVAEVYLKEANAAPQLVSMFGYLINHYYLLNNEIAKHNDKVDKTYLEFLLYQTGVFIRMLIVVKQEHKEAPNAG